MRSGIKNVIIISEIMHLKDKYMLKPIKMQADYYLFSYLGIQV
jgi:hypothetical protein